MTGHGPSRSPLAGKRIVITRSRAQAGVLSEKLAHLGAEPILFPTIEIAPMEDYQPLDSAVRRLADYQWIVFTSANGVAAFWERLAAAGLAGDLPPSTRLAAVGPATARALEQHGQSATFIPDEYVAEALAAGLGDVAGARILLPHAELAREVLADALRARGATVDEIAAYRTLPPAPDPFGLAELARGVDALTFTSASTARNFARLLEGSGLAAAGPAAASQPAAPPDRLPWPALRQAIVACIGPVTAAGVRQAGLPVDVVAATYTLDGLVDALAGYFARPATRRKENE